MTKTVLYHNPNCSKSRAALALLQTLKIPFEIREYLQEPPKRAELERLLGLLKIAPMGLIRVNEAVLQEQGITLTTLDDEALINLCVRYPILIERPILIHQEAACIGRPIENLTQLLRMASA